MRMMGVHPTVFFLAWFLENMAVLALSSVALAVILKASGIFAHSNACIIFLFLLDFGVSVVMLSYFLSVFFSRANTAALCTSLVYMISFLPYIVLLVLHNQLSVVMQTFLVSFFFFFNCCIYPNKSVMTSLHRSVISRSGWAPCYLLLFIWPPEADRAASVHGHCRDFPGREPVRNWHFPRNGVSPLGVFWKLAMPQRQRRTSVSVCLTDGKT